MTTSAKKMLRWASGIMLVLAVGHLVLGVLGAGGQMAGWLEVGPWAAVPLDLGTDEASLTVAGLRSKLTFWASVGGFSFPLILLGWLTWHLAGRGIAPPAGIGWVLAAWCAVGGVLLVPSPFFVGVVAGLLIVLAARRTAPA